MSLVSDQPAEVLGGGSRFSALREPLGAQVLAATGTHTAGADPKAVALAQLHFAAGVARELGDQVGYRLAEQARAAGATVAEISEAALDQHGTLLA
jgi:hypothetical protein